MSKDTPKLYVWTRDGMRESGGHEELSYVTRQAHERMVAELKRGPACVHVFDDDRCIKCGGIA